MKFTLLGTGTSTGVPSIGCDCETCTSDDPRDKRLRVSVLVEHAGLSVLVDTSSDFRQQALRVGLRRLDAEPGDEERAARVREEVGDLLFAAANIARHLGVEPEAALKLTNRKFRRRFRRVERGLKERGRELGQATLDEMEELWQEAKR